MKSFIIIFALISIIPVSAVKSIDVKTGVYTDASPLTGKNIVTSTLEENELSWQMNKYTKQLELYIQQEGKPVLLEVKNKAAHNTDIVNTLSHPRQLVNMN